MEINEELKDPKYTKAYSETKLFAKIKKFAKAAGVNVIYLALLLFYTLQQSTTPKWAKSVIIGALGYFIFPLDFIPDFIPIAGFSDDWTALLAVIIAVALYIDEDTKAKAKAKLHVWFGSYDEVKLDIIDNKINKQDRTQY
jgi:uncharacterized membrane protein YkvA (DUF1232 family)